MSAESEQGPLEVAVSADVGRLPVAQRGSGLAVLSIGLARALDAGDGNAAQLARELRATLLVLLADVTEEREETDLDRLRARRAR